MATHGAAADSHERAKDYLTPTEIQTLLTAAKRGRHSVRDHLLILMLFRHGYRESEACRIRRDHLDLSAAQLWVQRLKGGLSTQHPIEGDELRTIRAYLRSRTDELPWLFITERGAPFTRQGIYYLVVAIGRRAGLGHVHPHMLRHSCGYRLANKGYDLRLIQDYLGHRDPRHTMRYTRTAAARFVGLWG